MSQTPLVRQPFQIHPDVIAAEPTLCVGGPADGQSMQCPVGRWLFIIEAVDGLRGVSMPPAHLDLAKRLGGYVGHYEPGDYVLNWHAPETA